MKKSGIYLIISIGIILAAIGSYITIIDDKSSTIGENLSEPSIRTSAVDIENEQPEIEFEFIREPDVVYVATPQVVVDKMLELADVKKDDLVYDLGCGDGRIVVTAAQKYGCKAVGYDIDPERVRDSLENVRLNNVGDLVSIEQRDIFELDLSQADVITLYLLPSLNEKLIPQLEKLKPGSRIVSHDFDIESVIPDEVVNVRAGSSNHVIFLYTVPLNKEIRQDQTNI